MSRSIAFVAFLAISWSHVAGLRCEMGTGAVAMDAGHAAASASHGHHPTPTPSTPHPADHDSNHGCLMIMACSIASPRPARPAAMLRIPTVLVQAAFPTPPTPVAADLAVETPPPRRTV